MSAEQNLPEPGAAPPPWLLPVIAVAVIGAAIAISVALTRPPAPISSAAPTSAIILPTPAGPVPTGGPTVGEQPPHGQPDPNGPAIGRLSPAEAQARAAGGGVLFVDVRSGAEFAAGHIAGAASLASPDLDERVRALPPGGVIVVYSDAARGDSAVRAAQIFSGLGYPTALALDGGLEAWRQAGLPVEQGGP